MVDMFRAIIFDYNGVLIRDLEIHEQSYLKAAAEVGLSLRPEVVKKYISFAPEQKRELYFGDISDEKWEEIIRIKKAYYFDQIQKSDVLVPDARDVLTSLSGKYLLGLLSNTTRYYFERVLPADLALLFTETLFADEVQNPKPSPDPLLEMMKRLKVGRDQSCFVGDSIIDIRMARKVGVPIYAVATGNDTREELEEAGADVVLGSLTELKKLL